MPATSLSDVLLDGLRLELALALGLSDPEGDKLAEIELEGDSDPDGLTDSEVDELGDKDVLGDKLADTLPEGDVLAEGLRDAEGDRLADGLSDPDGLTEELGETLALGELRSILKLS